ncbi:MAG TPA: hypothetical protein VGO87_11245, partial [Acidimicrobiia bacterium]
LDVLGHDGPQALSPPWRTKARRCWSGIHSCSSPDARSPSTSHSKWVILLQRFHAGHGQPGGEGEVEHLAAGQQRRELPEVVPQAVVDRSWKYSSRGVIIPSF